MLDANISLWTQIVSGENLHIQNTQIQRIGYSTCKTEPAKW